jgi:hypothetical protein
VNAEELANAVEELDTKLERLRVLMDQYFQGIEKIPPFIVQKDVDRRIWVLRREKIRNTGTRFRFQQIIQRYNTFNSYWTRILREIENGTYKRDVMRARRRFGGDGKTQAQQQQQQGPASEPPPQSVDLDMELEDDDLSDLGELGPLPVGPAKPAAPPLNKPAAPPVAAKPAAPAAPAKPAALPLRAPPPKAPPSPMVGQILAKKIESDDDLDNMLDAALGTGAPEKPVAKPEPPKPIARPAPAAAPKPAAPAKSGDDYRRVYAQYVEARRANGESTAGLTYENLAKSLKDTTERLKTKSGGKPIDFEVQVKDGKTILKPVVR